MAKRGRPPLGTKHVHRLDADEQTKQRLEIILKTITGELTAEEACEQLDIGPTQLTRLRERALQGAAEALRPKPSGRPANVASPQATRVAELEDEVSELKMDLRASQLREEIAIVMPHLLNPENPGTKKNRAKRCRRKRRKK